MAPEPIRPTNAELAILEVLWQHGERSVREVATSIYGEPDPVQYRTSQVHLDRLEKKGLVERDRASRPHVFRAAVDRTGIIGGELQSLADKVCDGSLAPLIMNLARRASLTEDEKRELWKLLEDE